MKFPIYLDNSSTTPISKEVLDAMMPFLTYNFGNPSSRLTYHGMLANLAVDKARHNIAKLINAKAEEIIFTSGATESNNLAIKGILNAIDEDKKHIITSSIEHSSVLEVCRYLESIGYQLSFIKAKPNGDIDLKELENEINPTTGLISIMHVNNETGAIMPIEAIATIAQKNNIILHSDCVQSIDKIPIDVRQTNIDMLSFTAHKIYGPKGCGALYVNSKYLNKIVPIINGGGQEAGLRSGTLNTPSIVGLATAIEQVKTDNNSIQNLRNYFESELEKHLDIVINGRDTNRIHSISNITFKGVDAEKIILKLQGKISCSMASACSNAKNGISHVLAGIGLSAKDIKSSIRFSLGKYNTQQEIEYVVKALINTIK
ncbi:MAG: cysteine desulfurase family protein [Solitalea-like symbiont of Tyrophagus putrescentiae]